MRIEALKLAIQHYGGGIESGLLFTAADTLLRYIKGENK